MDKTNLAVNLRLLVTTLQLNEQNLLDKVVKKTKSHYLPLTIVKDAQGKQTDLYHEFTPNQYLIQQLELIIEKLEGNDT